MADTAIAITAGSGTNVDTRTEATNGNHRQVVVLGDPSTNAGVAPVDATAGLKVDLGADNDVTVTGSLTTVSTVTNLSQLGGAAVPIGAGTEAAAIRVTLPTNGTGIVGLAAGTNGIGKLTSNSGVDIGDVDVTSIVPGTAATNLGKAEDAAHTTGDTGVMALAVRQSANGPLSGADGDYEPLQTDANGHLKVNIIDALPAGTNGIGKLTSNSGVTIGAVEIAAAQTLATVTTVSTLTGGGIAHDGVDSGNPIKIGAKAETSPKGITLVADADRTDLYADADGLLMAKLNTSGADVVSERVSNTDGASTAFTNFSAVANTKNYITGFNVFRTDAGTTPIYVDFRDGTSGSILWSAVIPPNGGSNNPAYCGPALFKTSANTALAYDVSAATTTVYISVTGYQSKV